MEDQPIMKQRSNTKVFPAMETNPSANTFLAIIERPVDDISLDFFYKPHTVTLLAISIFAVMYCAFVRSPKHYQTSQAKQITPTPKPTSPKPKPVSGIKRMVLIDGNNVAYGHSRNREFSVEGIDICLKYFLEKGYDAKAIVPQMRLKKKQSTNQDLLAKLESEGKVVFSPCKNLPNGKKVSSYDDRFILDFDLDCDAAVISNDNYRDLSKESEKYRDIISTRVIGFTFLNDIIRFPQDPYGQFGPTLNDILNGKEK